MTVAIASHIEVKTGILIETLRAAGARVLVTASEPQSTDAAVIEALETDAEIECFLEADMDDEAWDVAQHKLLERQPDLLFDDGCELIAKAHASHPEAVDTAIGAAEQTTAGVTRAQALADSGALGFPIYAVNDTPMKCQFDNVHGTGESALTNLLITTNTVLAGKRLVVAGYGHCGRGIARKARGLGARTTVTEVDPLAALKAHMDGHEVAPMAEAASTDDLVLTATGNRDIVRGEHIDQLPDGAILANAGHFDVEVDVATIEQRATDTATPTPGITRYTLADGRRIAVVAGGRLVNLTGPASRGHPAEVMDTTFAMMAAAGIELATSQNPPPPGVHSVPPSLDRNMARRALSVRGLEIDSLTAAQREYQERWDHPDAY